jgi:hypothetical protein
VTRIVASAIPHDASRHRSRPGARVQIRQKNWQLELEGRDRQARPGPLRQQPARLRDSAIIVIFRAKDREYPGRLGDDPPDSEPLRA